MRKILCPTDFSDAAQNAVSYAAKFAKATGSSLTLLNVQSLFRITSDVFVPEKELVHTAVSERLEELRNEVQKFFKISCSTEITQSPKILSRAIAEKANGFDMIIMGTNGVEDLVEFFTGSITYHAIRKSKVPVLLIPSGCMYSEIRSIAFAYNYLREQKLPTTQLQPWIAALKCNLTILQINEEAISEDVNDEIRELQFIISDQLDEEGIKYNFDSIRTSEVATSINSYVHRNQNDLLALCTTHRNFIEQLFHKSVIKVISGIADYPVLFFHE